MSTNYIEARCPSERPHKIRGIEYSTCGQLMGAIKQHNNSAGVFRCPTCKVFWEVTFDDDEMIVTEMDTAGKKLEFKQHWRTIRGK